MSQNVRRNFLEGRESFWWWFLITIWEVALKVPASPMSPRIVDASNKRIAVIFIKRASVFFNYIVPTSARIPGIAVQELDTLHIMLSQLLEP
jgi:hypothetical protein